ncbi:MAG TPA: YIP1 family protein [Alphaproteobacteria bacterium]|nr:YIP1 family protein [Alphaproteobacteria bacterium]
MTTEPQAIDPWLAMWTKPRATIREIVRTDASYGVLPLAALGGVAQVLDRASARNLGDEYATGAILLVAALAGPVAGIAGIYIGAWLLRLTDGWLGGEAPSAHLRTALAWGNLPTAAGLLLWVPALALVGGEMFTAATPQLDGQPLLALFLLPIGLAWIALAIWSLVLVVLGVAEVQGFSGWRALGNLLLAALLFAAPFVLLGILVGALGA